MTMSAATREGTRSSFQRQGRMLTQGSDEPFYEEEGPEEFYDPEVPEDEDGEKKQRAI